MLSKMHGDSFDDSTMNQSTATNSVTPAVSKNQLKKGNFSKN